MHEVHPYRRAHPYSQKLLFAGIAYLAAVVLIFLAIGILTDANPTSVLLGFSPALLFGILLVVLIQTDHYFPAYNWLIAAVLLLLFAVLFIATPLGIGMDAGVIIALNVVIIGSALFFMQNLTGKQEPIMHPSPAVVHKEAPVVVKEVHIHEAPKELAAMVHSIEDKVKALNFVIGRVYSVYKGGTDELRNKVRIDKAWYDDFNNIPESDMQRRRQETIALLEKIRARLQLWQRTEREVFGEDALRLKNLVHNQAGHDKIIDVLVKNDKDPVQQYYDGALRFCNEALSELKKR